MTERKKTISDFWSSNYILSYRNHTYISIWIESVSEICI